MCRSLKAATAARTKARAPAAPSPPAGTPSAPGALENGTAGPASGAEGTAGAAGGGKEPEPRPVDVMLTALLRRLGTIEMDMQVRGDLVWFVALLGIQEATPTGW